MARLSIEELSVELGGKRILKDVSLEVEDGELVVLVGPSGCGKSTLLRAVAGLLPAAGGRIRIDGRDVTDLEPRGRDVAMVFQSYALYPHKSVRGNLAFPLRLARLQRAEIEARVARAAELLGLSGLLDRRPGELSGGQMQRVALGRAIVRSPRLFLFDEPLSNLDAKLREEMRGEILGLHGRLGITTLYVTHDQAEAMTMGSRVCVLEEGELQQVAPPLEVYDRPATAFVAAFIGSPPMNLVPGRIEAGRFLFEGGELPLGPAAPPEGEVRMGVRPHAVGEGEELRLEVSLVEERGDATLFVGRLAGAPFRVLRRGRGGPEPGGVLGLALPREALHWFEAASGRRLAP